MMHYTIDRVKSQTAIDSGKIYSGHARKVLRAVLALNKERVSADEVSAALDSAGLSMKPDTITGFRSILSKCYSPLGLVVSDRKVVRTTTNVNVTKTGVDEAAVETIVVKKLAELGQGHGIDATAIASMIREEMAKARPTTIKVEAGEGKPPVDMGMQHKSFPTLLRTLSARTANGYHLNVWLTGPAGTGKTTAAANCAKALNLKFFFTGAIDNQYGILGYKDANGKTVRTQFREAYEHGGVFLFDEVDASAPGAVLAFNAALANGCCAFPDGVVERHKDFVCVAAANTWGLGATNDYVGRLKMDAAFLDRFVQIFWGNDDNLEIATAGDVEWVARVQHVRRRAHELGIKVVISPRASYYGAALLASGLDRETVETMTLKKAMTEDQWRAVNQK